MELVLDLHLHSRFSRAVSQRMNLANMYIWGRKKGINVLSVADFTHPIWFREARSLLEETNAGIYRLRDTKQADQELGELASKDFLGPYFMLSTEVSAIYSENGVPHRIHNLIFAPSFEVAEKINAALVRMGINLSSDGRPILGLSSKVLAQVLFEIDRKIAIIPCHAWTPWFSLYGSRSGYDRIADCFGEYTKYIFAVETGLSCYDKETEVLTEKGWRRFSDLNYKDKICTLNIDNNIVEYQFPTKIHKYDHKGKMYRLKTKRVDLLVTPNHRLLFSPCDFRKPPKFSLREAELLYNKSKRFKKDGIWIGKDEKYFTLPAVRIPHGSQHYSGTREKKEKQLKIELWLKFFGFWIAEGWTTKGRNGDYNVCIANTKKDLLIEMKQILERLGYTVFQSKRGTVRVRDYQLYQYLRQLGKSFGKYVPIEIKSLSKELLETFLEYYLKGDGHVYGRDSKGLSATTSSVQLRDDLQEIALKVGISAYYKQGAKKGTPLRSLHGGKYKSNYDVWIIYFIRRNKPIIIPSVIKKYSYIESWIDFTGPIFCVTVPNHVIYIRRNGIPLWCGNSDPAMNWRINELETRSIVSFSDAHSLEKMGREATVLRSKNHESRIKNEDITYDNILNSFVRGKERIFRIGYTIEFYPEEGKYHYTGHRLCKISYSPDEDRSKGTICPVCRKPLTVGVMNRVEELANVPSNNFKPRQDQFGVVWMEDTKGARPPYVSLVPLLEILSECLRAGTATATVLTVFDRLVNHFGSEHEVLFRVALSEIRNIAGDRVAQGIEKVRARNIKIEPGFDGEYGRVAIWNSEEEIEKTQEKSQLGLGF